MDNLLEVANITGLEKSKFERVRFELNTLLANGLLVDLDVRGTTIFSRKANLAELGISDSTRRDRYTPGSKYLIDRKYVDSLRSVTQRMRVLLENQTLEVTGFAPWRWLPFPAYYSFKRRWDTLLQEFNEIKVEIIENYYGELDKLAADFRIAAERTWDNSTSYEVSTMIAKNSSGETIKVFLNRNDFIDWVIESAQDMFPTIGEIQEKLYADYRVGILEMEANTSVFQAAQEAGVESYKAQVATAQAQKELAGLEVEKEKLALQERRARYDAIMQAEIEHAKAQISDMGSPFAQVFTSLRNQIAADCQEILESITSNGFVHGKVAERASGLVELYKLLSIHDDKELRDLLNTLKLSVETDIKSRSVDKIGETLEKIMALAHESAEVIGGKARAAFLEME